MPNISDYFRPYPELKTVIVNLKSGTVFKAVIWRRGRGGFMILRNAQMLRDKGVGTQVVGEVLVPLADIEFIQVVD